MLFDLDNTLYDFVRVKEEACDAVVAITGGTRSGLIEEFLFGPWGVESSLRHLQQQLIRVSEAIRYPVLLVRGIIIFVREQVSRVRLSI